MGQENGKEKLDKGPWVSELTPGQEFIGFYLARNPRLDPFRDPSRGRYLRMQLADRTGAIEARLWQEAEQRYQELNGSSVIKVMGRVGAYREELQVNILRVRPAREEEIDPADMVRTTERDIEKMWEAVQEAIDTITDPYLLALVEALYRNSDWTPRLMASPSACRVHHSYWGGFLEHTYELLLLAEPLVALYPVIDRDLLVSGILLHDIGKLEELTRDLDFKYSDEGRLLGHIILGERMVSRAIDAIDDFPRERALEILHLLVSHHRRREWGSPRRPKSIEAIALHHLDHLNAQVNRFKLLTEEARGNGEPWTNYDRRLGRSVYVGNGIKPADVE